MTCTERDRLLIEYKDALLESSQATLALAEVAGKLALADYHVLLTE